MSQLILSIYHGIDLLGRGFEKAGFCVVRAAELDLGFDAEEFTPIPNKFDGIIAGTPCNDFSLANRSSRTYNGYGKKQLENFARIVLAAQSQWALLENVPQVPNIDIAGYSRQRFDLNANECGLDQSRLRHFQFFSRTCHTLTIDRSQILETSQPCVISSEGKTANRRGFADICELQGLPRKFTLPYFTIGAKYKVVGQGVPVEMAARIANAIAQAIHPDEHTSPIGHTCKCGCGRRVTGRQLAATAACRKRIQRQNDPNTKIWL